TGDNPPATTPIWLLVHDQGNTGIGGELTGGVTGTIHITPANDAPTANSYTNYSAIEQVWQPLEHTGNFLGTGLSVGDVDANNGTLQAAISVPYGLLRATAGATGVTIA